MLVLKWLIFHIKDIIHSVYKEKCSLALAPSARDNHYDRLRIVCCGTIQILDMTQNLPAMSSHQL